MSFEQITNIAAKALAWQAASDARRAAEERLNNAYEAFKRPAGVDYVDKQGAPWQPMLNSHTGEHQTLLHN